MTDSLGHWTNDWLVGIFFFVVGLEFKREVLVGELTSPRQAALPIAAALGGVAVPAVIYAVLNAGTAGADGWGIPMATDITFALGVLAVLVTRALVTSLTGKLTPHDDDPVRTWREAALLTWSGLRGALAVALVLALPPATPHREVLVAMTFGVVLFTLVVQGLTLPILIRRLEPKHY